jgi:hypothetical protein
VWWFLLFDLAIGSVNLGVGDIVFAVLLAAALWWLLAVLGGGGRLDHPCDIRNMNRIYHIPIIGKWALEL